MSVIIKLEDFKKFLKIYYEFFKKSHNENINEIIENFYEKLSDQQKKKSIEITLSDFAGEMIGWSSERIKAADDIFIKNDLPSVSLIILNYSKKIKSILKAAQIKNENEYFLIKELMDNRAHIFNDASLVFLEKMILAYEEKISKNIK